MAKKKTADDWVPPVGFYFRVDFQRGSEHFKISFMEISGLEMSFGTKKMPNPNTVSVSMPNHITFSNITLKRPIAALSDSYTQWINDSFVYLEGKTRQIKTYDMVIKLLNKDGKPLAGWLARHTYPIKWNLDSMNAMENNISKESIEMACNSLKRLTNIR